ncbi:hypothetical protein N9L02_02690 [Gammaproteobacteria bacterium]|nr:hypothetical protein [Gammaproteobacteria bacterium]
MKSNSLLFGIAGIQEFEKNSITTEIIKKLREDNINSVLIKTDNYYKKEFNDTNFKLASSINMDSLYNDLCKLKNNKSIKRKINTFLGEEDSEAELIIFSQQVIILEGEFLLADARIRKLLSTTFFVNTSFDRAITRKDKLEIEKKQDINKSLNFYESRTRSTSCTNILNLKSNANFILLNESTAQKEKSINTVYQIIKNKLKFSTQNKPRTCFSLLFKVENFKKTKKTDNKSLIKSI